MLEIVFLIWIFCVSRFILLDMYHTRAEYLKLRYTKNKWILFLNFSKWTFKSIYPTRGKK